MISEMTQRDEMLMMISDMHKDAYGVRPYNNQYINMTDVELQREMELLQIAVERAIREDEDREEIAIKTFKARIADMFDLGAADEATAMRWIIDAEECQDMEELEYRLGLPFGYLRKEDK